MATTLNFSIASGKIYTKTSGVTAISDDEVAEFKGDLDLLIDFEGVVNTEQERFRKSSYESMGQGVLVVRNLLFRPTIFNKQWGITANASDTLNDGSTAATSYTIGVSSKPQFVELLLQCTKTGNAKKFEIQANKAKAPRLAMHFPRTDGVVEIPELTFLLFADVNGNVVVMKDAN